MIYLASPYSHPDPAVREARFDAACQAAGRLMAAGHLVYSPIAHTHSIAVRCALPLGWDYWQRFDEVMLRACARVLVLMLPGWQESKGVAAEVKIAEALGLPVDFEEPA